jgi:hypothetical protein
VALADATRLPFADDSFDAGLIIHVLHLWSRHSGSTKRERGPGRGTSLARTSHAPGRKPVPSSASDSEIWRPRGRCEARSGFTRTKYVARKRPSGTARDGADRQTGNEPACL